MTRKRFVKLCMGRLGMSRNEANRIARSKKSAFADALVELAILCTIVNAFDRHFARDSDEVR